MSGEQETSSELVASAKSQVDPLFLSVIEVLNDHHNFYPMAFFSELLIQLRQIDTEVDLLHLFFELSTTAFQGFSFTHAEAETVDLLLERCETIAFTLSADSAQTPH
jgi:hypothetical protein